MTRSFYTDSMKVERPGSRIDGNGDTVDDPAKTTIFTITGVRFQWVSADELVDRRDGAVIVARILGPIDTKLRMSDRPIWQGEKFVVTTPPVKRRSPNGRADHSTAALKRVTG